MEHNPITSGDLAYSQATANQARAARLEARVAALEERMAEVIEWSDEITRAVNAIAVIVGYDGV